MPTSTTSRLPFPKDAKEFESITVDVLNSLYQDRNFQVYGRPGQKQHGIDVKTLDDGELIAAQCKDYTRINPDDIRSIVASVDTNAGNLKNLKQLIIAVAVDRDTKCQDEVHKINESKMYPFAVDIMFWEDFTKLLLENPELLPRYYPQYAYARRATNTTFFVKIFVSSECGSDTKFVNIRQELKHRLSMIPFVQSFFTEIDLTASTGSREGIEQDWIDDCDYCIFMVNNANPKDQSVSRHYKRTQEQNKKCFFVFCDEESKEKSYIEDEQGRKGCPYQTIHHFNDFPEEVYYALVNDIARVYHCYACGRLVDPEQIRNEERALKLTSSELINVNDSSFFLDEKEDAVGKLSQARFSSTGAQQGKSKNSAQSLPRELESISIELQNGSQSLSPKLTLSSVPQALDKKLMKELTQSIEYLYKYVTGHNYLRHGDKGETRSELDDQCTSFLRVLTHQRDINEFKVDELIITITNKVTGDNHLLEDVIKARWDAIIDFFSGRIESCLKKLEKVLVEIVENGESLEGWFVQDLLIDLRNVDMIRREESSIFPYSEKYQSMIDETRTVVVYPGIDREIKDFYQTINEKQIKKEFEKPGTVSFGDDTIAIIRYIANATANAMCYGSLTYLIQFDYYMRDLFIFLAKRNQIWKNKIDALKYTAACGTKQDLDKLLNSWNDILARITEREAKIVYDFTQSIPYKHRRFRKALNVFEFFGYYFGDEDYKECVELIVSRIDDWMRDEKPSSDYCADVCKFFQNNVLRLGSDTVVNYFVRMMSPNFKLNMRAEAFKMLQSVRFDEVNEAHRKTVYGIILDAIKNKESAPGLEEAVLSFRVSLKEDEKLLEMIGAWAEFDRLVNENLPSLHGIYELEIQQNDAETQTKTIRSCTERIKLDIDSEEGKALFPGLMRVGDNTYLLLLNTLKYDGLAIEKDGGEQKDKLLLAMRVTFDVLSKVVMNNTLSITDKRAAFLAMMIISQRVRDDAYKNKISSLSREIAEKDGYIFGNNPFGNETCNSAYWAYLLWSLSGSVFNPSDFFLFSSNFSTLNAEDRISVVDAVSIWTQYSSIDDKTNKGIIQNIVGILISASRDQVFGVRKYAVKALMNLLAKMHIYKSANQPEENWYFKLSEPMLIAISSRMEEDLPMVKCIILDKQETLEKYGGSLVEGIIERGRIDSNYIVRNRKRMYW